MGNIATSPFTKTIPTPLVKTVDLLASPKAGSEQIRINIVLSLQLAKIEEASPFGLFVAFVNDHRTLNELKNNERTLRYEIANKVTPSTKHAMLKRYIGVEDFVTDGKIKHILNNDDGTGVVVKDIPISLQMYPAEDQNLWIYCVAYEMANDQDNVKVVGSGENKKFSISDPVIEPIMLNGVAPTTTYLYWLAESFPRSGKKGEAWTGPVHRRARKWRKQDRLGEWAAGKESWTRPQPRLKRTKVSNQKIKDLRLLEQIEDLDIDNFVVNMRNINKKNFRNYERIKQSLGKRYFSSRRYSRSSTGDFKILFSMDYDAFINDNCKFAGLFTNKESLKSCYGINEIVVFRERVNFDAAGSSLTDDIVVTRDDMFQWSPKMIGSLAKGNITVLDIDDDTFLDILINDASMRDEGPNKYQYTVNFEFVDKSARVLTKIVRRLQRNFAEFESFMSKFEGLGKRNFDVEEYLRVNAKVIKSDDSWLKLINEFLASIWFIFGSSGFGDQNPITWKKNLTTMVNPMSATEQTLGEFTETIKDYITDLQRIVEEAVVGQSDKKLNVRSGISRGNNLVRKIKLTHEPRVVKKSAANGIGFDYLGIGRYVEESDTGLSRLSYEQTTTRMFNEMNKYQVQNPNALSINKYGFLSPQRIHTPYEIQDTFADQLELADGLVILDSNLNPGMNEFTSEGPVGEESIKVSLMTSLLGSAAITLEPLSVDLTSYIEGRKDPEEDDQSADSDNYFDPTTFPISGEYLENQASGSSHVEFARLQAQQRKVKALESDLAERLVDGVAQKFIPPRIRRTRNIRGSLALAKIWEDPDAFRDLNSFERDINYNSIVRIQVLAGYRDGDIRRARWRTLTQNRFNELQEEGKAAICRLKRCPSVTSPGSQYRLGRFNYLFVLGDHPESQDEIIKTSYRKRYNYYHRRLTRLDNSWTTNINRSAANYGAEYYTPNSMIFKLKRPPPPPPAVKKSKKSKRKRLKPRRDRPKSTRLGRLQTAQRPGRASVRTSRRRGGGRGRGGGRTGGRY